MKKWNVVLMFLVVALVLAPVVQAADVVLDPMTLGAIVDTPPRDGVPGRWWDLRGMAPNPALKESAFSHDGDGSMMIDYSYNITETTDDDPPGSWYDREVSGFFRGVGVYAPAMPDLSLDGFTPGSPNPNLAFSLWVWTAGGVAPECLRELQIYSAGTGKRALFVVDSGSALPPLPPGGWQHVIAPLTSFVADAGFDWTDDTEVKFFTSSWKGDPPDWVASPTTGSPVYIDDFRLVPEPATMMLLGLGTLALLKRRKA